MRRIERALMVTGKVSLWIALVLAITGLAFRSLVWASWNPQGDDPYGASDILDGLIFLVLVAFSGLCVLCGIGLVLGQPPRFRLLIAGIIVPAMYFVLHPLVPIFELW
jgi:hypothetical protein